MEESVAGLLIHCAMRWLVVSGRFASLMESENKLLGTVFVNEGLGGAWGKNGLPKHGPAARGEIWPAHGWLCRSGDGAADWRHEPGHFAPAIQDRDSFTTLNKGHPGGEVLPDLLKGGDAHARKYRA